MAAFLVDPFAQTVIDVEPRFDQARPLLDNLRLLMDAQLLTLAGVAHNRLALVIDGFGFLRRPQAFWSFAGERQRVAGRAVLFAIDPSNGMLAPIRDDALAELEAAIRFHPDVALIRVEERILTEEGEVPAIARIPIFSDDPEPQILKDIDEELARNPMVPGSRLPSSQAAIAPPPVPGAGWVVQARQDGSVMATRYTLEGEALKLAEMRSAADLPSLRQLMPANLVRREPGDDEPSDVLELWVEDV